ncbi:MAG: glycosyltransferase [Opitutaceae bacterium]|nr:glycosyltransferase [Opitutaceae bacterium]
MKRLLIVSPHFPPVNAPDLQRVRMSLPRFVERGWEVTVLTVDDPTPVAPLDPELAATIPAAVRVVRVRCLSRRWTGRLGVNNVAWRAFPFLLAGGRRLLRGRRFDVVYFSTTMFAVLPLGRLWRALHGVPYVIDLQDPWLSDFHAVAGAPPPPGGWKYRVAQGLARLLEGWTLRRAAHLVSVSAGYVETLRRRYPWFAARPATVLPFGSPDRDLARVRATLDRRPPVLPGGGPARLAYVGRLGADMGPALAVLFAGLARARTPGPAPTVHLLGTSYAPAGTGRPSATALAEAAGVGALVRESPDRIPYFAALQVLLQADANLIFGSDDAAYVPSKILPALAAGRPVLALAPRGSQLAHRLAELGGAHLVTFSGPDDGAAVFAAARLLQELAAGRLAPLPASAGLAAQSGDAVADRQLAILESACTWTLSAEDRPPDFRAPPAAPAP